MHISKKTMVIIGLVIVFIGIVSFSLFWENTINSNAQLLVVKSYSNYASGFVFYGTAIFDDGSILTWNNIKESKEYSLGTIEGLKQYILNEGKLKMRKVSNNDLENLKRYIYKVEDKIEIAKPGADQGITSIYVINANNEEITLKCDGDWIGKNQTVESEKILKIVKKYF